MRANTQIHRSMSMLLRRRPPPLVQEVGITCQWRIILNHVAPLLPRDMHSLHSVEKKRILFAIQLGSYALVDKTVQLRRLTRQRLRQLASGVCPCNAFLSFLPATKQLNGVLTNHEVKKRNDNIKSPAWYRCSFDIFEAKWSLRSPSPHEHAQARHAVDGRCPQLFSDLYGHSAIYLHGDGCAIIVRLGTPTAMVGGVPVIVTANAPGGLRKGLAKVGAPSQRCC